MNEAYIAHLTHSLEELKKTGLYKQERVLHSPQGSEVVLSTKKPLLNFCANNYLGLANHPDLLRAAAESYARYGFGLASVRFICGTQTVHLELEAQISSFLGTEATILYGSCFDANGGLFETLLGPEDAIISDTLNHASIIDGIRLSKAARFRYQNNDMEDLERQLRAAASARFRLIATDGVFSMDGVIANLRAICDLADRYGALVMIDDCHAAGFLGKEGRGTPEACGVMGRVDIITGTLGKALGGASGGYVSGRREIIEWLRQRSRPYLFSNTLCPSIAAASLEVFRLLEREGATLRKRLWENTDFFRQQLSAAGFTLSGNRHPIVPVLLGDAQLTQRFAQKMLEEGIYVVGFCYPVVPHNQARIRTQLSAAHRKEDLDRALSAFIKVREELNRS